MPRILATMKSTHCKGIGDKSKNKNVEDAKIGKHEKNLIQNAAKMHFEDF